MAKADELAENKIPIMDNAVNAFTNFVFMAIPQRE
jgi:hypothetical protein